MPNLPSPSGRRRSSEAPGDTFLVVAKKPKTLTKTAYYCFRYSFVRQWVVSVDRRLVGADDALLWLATESGLGA